MWWMQIYLHPRRHFTKTHWVCATKMCHINVTNANLHSLKKLVYKDTLSLCIKMCHINVRNANLHSTELTIYKDTLSLCIKICHINVRNANLHSLEKLLYKDTLSDQPVRLIWEASEGESQNSTFSEKRAFSLKFWWVGPTWLYETVAGFLRREMGTISATALRDLKGRSVSTQWVFSTEMAI